MSAIEEIYLRAKDAHEKAKNRLLRINEVKKIVSGLWSDLFDLYENDSIEWRIVDKGRKEHTAWWTVPTISDYAKELEAANLNVIIQVIETITGKEKIIKTPRLKKEDSENNHTLNQITGRTRWDFFSELHRRYKPGFVLMVIFLLLYLGWPR